MTNTRTGRDFAEDRRIIDEFLDGWFPGGSSNNTRAFVMFGHLAIDGWPAALDEIDRLRRVLSDIYTYPPFDETSNGDRFYEQMREAAKEALNGGE